MYNKAIKNADNSYTYRHYNSGYGIDNHQKRIVENPEGSKKYEVLYQTTYITGNISKERMKAYLADMEKAGSGRTIDETYHAIRELGGEKFEEGKPPPRGLRSENDGALWNRAQLGGSCTGTVTRHLFRSMLTPESYETFEKKLVLANYGALSHVHDINMITKNPESSSTNMTAVKTALLVMGHHLRDMNPSTSDESFLNIEQESIKKDMTKEELKAYNDLENIDRSI